MSRVEYQFLNPDQRTALERWLRDHDIDPKRTPIDPIIEVDTATGELRIEQFWHDENGKMRLDETGENVRRVIVRRRAQRPLPWPTWAQQMDLLWEDVTAPEQQDRDTATSSWEPGS